MPTIAHEPLCFYSLFHLSRSLSKINVNARSFQTGSNVNRGSIFVQNWLPSQTTRRWICSNLDCGRSGVEKYWPTSADNIIRGFQNRLFKRRKTGRKFRERSWYHAVFCEKSLTFLINYKYINYNYKLFRRQIVYIYVKKIFLKYTERCGVVMFNCHLI